MPDRKFHSVKDRNSDMMIGKITRAVKMISAGAIKVQPARVSCLFILLFIGEFLYLVGRTAVSRNAPRWLDVTNREAYFASSMASSASSFISARAASTVISPFSAYIVYSSTMLWISE